MVENTMKKRSQSTRTAKAKLIAILVLPLVLLAGCAEEPAETTTPSAVLEQERTSKFGQTADVQRVLLKSKDLAIVGFEETGSLDLTSDYFNVRDGEITFTETWPGSWGVARFHLVTLWPSKERLVVSSKDSSAVCWYIDIRQTDSGLTTRYGASIDPGCRANDVDASSTLWQEETFPSGPIAGQTTTSDSGNNGTVTNDGTNGQNGNAQSQNGATTNQLVPSTTPSR
jgi:hypothetical protein